VILPGSGHYLPFETAGKKIGQTPDAQSSQMPDPGNSLMWILKRECSHFNVVP